jgi:hypothetical protein
MRARSAAAAALAWCAAAALVAAQEPPRFAWHLPLTTPGAQAFYRVDVPAPVYERIQRADLGDVRVLNADGAAVPFAFLPPPPAARAEAALVDLPLFPLRVDDARRDLGDLALSVRRGAEGTSVDVRTRDGGSVQPQRLAGYLVDAGERKDAFAALRLTPAATSNVDVRVRVDGSDDLATWRTLASGAPLLALEYRGQRLARDRVALSGAPARYLRITFAPPATVLELASARGEEAARAVEAPRQWRDAEGVADRDHPGDYTFDIGGVFPVDRVTVALPEINTVAPAQVLARADVRGDAREQDSWRLAGTTVFYRLRQDGAEAANPPLAIPPTPRRHWKVRIDAHAGGIGDKPPRLSVGWLPHTLVFAARGSGPFVLAYGSAQATAAALPIGTLVPGYDERTSPATFGMATPGASATAAAADALRKPVDVKRWLLWGALGFATLVLAWMAIRLSRQMGSAGKPRGDAAPPEV